MNVYANLANSKRAKSIGDAVYLAKVGNIWEVSDVPQAAIGKIKSINNAVAYVELLNVASRAVSDAGSALGVELTVGVQMSGKLKITT